MKNQIKYIIIAFLCAVSGTVWAEGAKPSADSVKVKNYVIGRVTDAVSGEPLMGVTVTSAPGVSTLTDEDGRYRIPVDSYGCELRFSAPGFLIPVPLRCAELSEMVL